MPISKTEEVLVRWETGDKWDGVEQDVKRTMILPEQSHLSAGQQAHVKWQGKKYKVTICKDWAPSSSLKRKASDDIPLSKVAEKSENSRSKQSKQYSKFLQEQAQREKHWGQQTKERLAQPRKDKNEELSEKSSPSASSVPVAVITVSPNKKTKDSEQETTRKEAAELKQKLEEVTRSRYDTKTRE